MNYRRVSGRGLPLLIAAVMVASAVGSGVWAPAPLALPDDAIPASVDAASMRLPLAFEENTGQADGATRYLARGQGYTLFLTDSAALLMLEPSNAEARQAVVRLTPLGANPDAASSGDGPLPGVVNAYIGDDPALWREGIPTWAGVRYNEIYPGVDLLYHGRNGALEYDFIVAPGADPGVIHLGLSGVDELNLGSDGTLTLATAAGLLRQGAPLIYQDIGGARKTVSGGFALLDGGAVGFRIGAYDSSLPLVIDPTIEYSTVLGGGLYDSVQKVALDGAGNVYISGTTASTNTPTANGQPAPLAGGRDAFIAKLSPNGATLLYTTYYGGAETDNSRDLAVGSGGDAWIAGFTGSANLPTLGTGVQTTYGGGVFDGFGARFSSTGTLLTATYIGGSSEDVAGGVATDSSGAGYFTGYTRSTNFPTANPFQSTLGPGGAATFVVKLNSGGAKMYATYFGGNSTEYGGSIGVSSAGEAVIVGRTESTQFPLVQPIQSVNGGLYDLFITRFNAAGSALVFSTFLGGTGLEFNADVLVTSGGDIYGTGSTGSSTFPQTNLPVSGGGRDVLAFKISAANQLVWSGRFGGSGTDEGSGITIDASGNTYVTGLTASSNFVVERAVQGSYGGGESDAFVTAIAPNGTAFVYSSYLGGTATDSGNGVAVDGKGNAWYAGDTSSANFQLISPIDVSVHGFEGFLTRISTFRLTATITGKGQVTSGPTGITCPGDCVETFANAQKVGLRAVAQTGSRFDHWEGACVGSVATTCVIIMSGDLAVTAVFVATQGIDVAVILDAQRGTLTLTGHIACPPGRQATIDLTITQQSTGGTASGTTQVLCVRPVTYWTMVITRLQPGQFVAGPAAACAVATIRQGERVVDTRKWCKDVLIGT